MAALGRAVAGGSRTVLRGAGPERTARAFMDATQQKGSPTPLRRWVRQSPSGGSCCVAGRVTSANINQEAVQARLAVVGAKAFCERYSEAEGRRTSAPKK
jgi:hypothetical protein